MAALNGSVVDTCYGSDVVPAAHVACSNAYVLHDAFFADGSEESASAAACYGFFCLEHGDAVAITVEGSLECRAVSIADRMPWQLHKTVGNQVIVKSEMSLGTTVVDIVGYPVEVTEGLDDISAVCAALWILHRRTFVGMQTALAGAEAVSVEVMAYASLLKVHLMEALVAGIFHNSVFAVCSHFSATFQRMGEFLEESASTINHVRGLVNGQLLLTKIFVLCRDDIVTHQTPLVVFFPVRGTGRKFMLLNDHLSAIQTFLVVYRIAIILGFCLGKLHPHIIAVHLWKTMGLLHREFASVKIAIMLVFKNALGR